MFTTFLNENNKPMMRSCSNCANWKPLENKKDSNLQVNEMGYCRKERMFHYKTMEPTCMPLTKYFYLCPAHRFSNEKELQENATKIGFEQIIQNAPTTGV